MNRVTEMKAETDVGKSRWPAKWKIMFYTDADTNTVNKNLKDMVICIHQAKNNEKNTHLLWVILQSLAPGFGV